MKHYNIFFLLQCYFSQGYLNPCSVINSYKSKVHTYSLQSLHVGFDPLVLLHAPILAYFSSFYEQSVGLLYRVKKSSLCKHRRREGTADRGHQHEDGRVRLGKRLVTYRAANQKKKKNDRANLHYQGELQMLTKRHSNEAHAASCNGSH